ncbi:hypothetical protein TWF569_009478 [Orbilia oligospora]|uniref:Ribosome recycling factor domain-containing protein n=2 Tax=Orbilia oligospora TaxID=2813651 RepID=A0A7C8N7J8_ORBOL|nr:hypothetical protein TWF103_002919 [Orbilia oligospora]KAF3087463.1 hypothetical protein TWF102_010529 [Orbilia oligospora]KAF3136489.1 hypothetical protein TWF569_009478 [Orbilia oligospora]KAF3152982.1 hypothetical protein TWF594_000033 [Orbilia oligospora]
MSLSRSLIVKKAPLSLRGLAGTPHVGRLSGNPTSTTLNISNHHSCHGLPLIPFVRSTRAISTTPMFLKKNKGPTNLKDEAPEQYSRKGKPNPAHAAAAAETPNDDPYNFKKFDDSVKHAVEGCKTEIQHLKSFSGRVDPSVIENLLVIISHGKKEDGGKEAKEVKLKLSELAHVAPKGREFILTVNDESFVNNIKNTILSQMSMNPQQVSPSTPNILKVPIPMPTKESRQNTATLVQKAGQKWLDKVQYIRGSHFTHLEKLKKAGTARPDDVKKAEKKLQEKLDKTNKELKQLIEKSKQDVLQS